jgi:flagellar basal-body rod protein FlgB
MSQPTIKLLENFAGYCALKNKIIAKNIANVGTENYHSQDVVFKNVLDDNMTALLKTDDSRQFGANKPDSLPEYNVVTDKSNNDISGVNNVDIDKQMSELAVNNLNFQFTSKKIGDYFRNIQMVIKGNV